MIQRIKDGLPAMEPVKDSFAVVVAEWMKRHVEAEGLRTGDEYQRVLDRYILPEWADTEFASIRRSDITALMDKVQDENGARQADYCLASIRAICNWYERRNDDYRSPVAKGMRRVSAKRRHASASSPTTRSAPCGAPRPARSAESSSSRF